MTRIAVSLIVSACAALAQPQNWTAQQDHQNMMDQLGIKALRPAPMPPINTGWLDGQLAWRQHDGGHTDGPNWQYFVPWADKFLAK